MVLSERRRRRALDVLRFLIAWLGTSKSDSSFFFKKIFIFGSKNIMMEMIREYHLPDLKFYDHKIQKIKLSIKEHEDSIDFLWKFGQIWLGDDVLERVYLKESMIFSLKDDLNTWTIRQINLQQSVDRRCQMVSNLWDQARAHRADRRRRKMCDYGVYEDFEQAELLRDEAETEIYIDLHKPEEYIEPKVKVINLHKWDGYNRPNVRHHNHWTKAVEVAKIRRERKQLAEWKRMI